MTEAVATNLETDVVIVGTGVGGLSAAIEARAAGARIVVLDKEDVPGGTTRFSGGTPWTFKHPDSYHRHVPQGDPALQTAVVRGLPLAFDWLDSLGVPLASLTAVGLPRNAEGEPEMIEGHAVVVQRVDVSAWVDIAVGRVADALMLETGMRNLLVDPVGNVTGVMADGPRGPIRITAKAVVLATGGFGASRELLQRYVTPYADHLYARNSGYVTGDGLLAATAVGAATSSGGFASFYGHCLPARPARFTREDLLHITQQYAPIGLAMNLRGDRYTDEGETRMEETVCVDTATQPNATAFYIVDDRAYSDYLDPRGKFVSQGVDKIAMAREAGGVVICADSLEKLCEDLTSVGVPGHRALNTLTEYNHAASVGKAGLLDVPKSHFADPLLTPPYYAVMVQAGVTATYGGLKVNPNAQVLGRSGHPMPGLYACGTDVGNVNNRWYAGAWSLGLVFGRAAGQHAAQHARARRPV